MARWLVKTEPSTYSFDDLVKAKTATWDGVANPVAIKNIRAMKKGDEVFVYHTGDEKAIVGLATVTKEPYADPKDATGKLFVADLKVGQRLATAVSLATIKSDKAFVDWELVRQGRLSVMPVPDAIWTKILKMAEEAKK
jgi:predicted RNA-binding protein with PUA-like domain